MTYILPLAHTDATIEMTGGKGMSLSKMLLAGLPVPDGFHVTTEAYRAFVMTNQIGARIIELLRNIAATETSELERVSKEIFMLFKRGVMPFKVKSEILAAYTCLENAPVAVRSSATAEDLPDASFAGQQDTYLNIRGEKEVLAHIKRCWASLWTARAISYRLTHNINQEIVSLAVVIQRLVFSDTSGVMFTINPVSGNRGEVMINASWGLGEAVVGNLVTPDTVVVEKKSGRIATYEVAKKELMTIRTNTGTEEIPVAASQQKKRVLTARQAAQLTSLGKKIEQYYDMPMDVEWALEKDKIYIVQARPITVLPPVWTLPEQGVIYTKGSLAEHLPNPVTPLFATLGLEIVNRASALLWDDMFGKSAEKLLPKHGAYAIINGYVYLSAINKPALIAVKSLTPENLRKTLRGSVGRWETAYKEFEAVVLSWEKKAVDSMSAGELLNGVKTVFGAACTYFTSIQLTLPTAFMSETLFTKLFKAQAASVGIPDISAMLVGYDTFSLQSDKALWELAEWVSNAGSDFASDEFKARLDKYFDEFGSTAYEFDFAYPTPREATTPTLESIKSYMTGKSESPFDRQAGLVKRRKQAEAAMLYKLRGPRKALFQKLLRWAQATGPMRENAIYAMGKGHPIIRKMLGEIAARMILAGAITHTEDIYCDLVKNR
jgi:pyruvate,water dikinase